MGESTESEIKYLLQGAEDYRRLAGPGGLGEPRRTERQENFYLDTADGILSGKRIMLRLRRLSTAAVLTWKRGAEVEAGFFRSQEIEGPLSLEEAAEVLAHPAALYHLPLPPVEETRARFGELTLQVVGSLVNERTFHQAPGFQVELDRVTFPDGSQFFEVEVETEDPSAARAWLEETFRSLGVNAAPSRMTKLARLKSAKAH
jgi:uncharacterized protein YjbK